MKLWRVGIAGDAGSSRRAHYVWLVPVLALSAVVGSFLNGSNLQLAVRVLIFITLGVAWNFMGGFAGLFSFGHAAYFGLGAYAGAYLLVTYEVSPWVGMVAGAVAASAFGAATTWLAVRYRVRGVYFALGTFAFAELLYLISLHADFIGGTKGLTVPILGHSSFWLLQFHPGSHAYFYIMLFILGVCMAVVIWLVRGKFGLRLMAMRDDIEGATAAGVNVRLYSVVASAVSAAITAVVGVFYVQFTLYVDPTVAFGQNMSIQILLPAIVGGLATIWGPWVGGAVIVVAGEFFTRLVQSPPGFLSFLSGRSGLDLAFYAILLMVVIILAPRGIYGSLRRGGL